MPSPKIQHPQSFIIKPVVISREEALEYHASPRAGKIEVMPTKPYSNRHDLSLAYSPGVAYASEAIHDNIKDVYKFTNKGNLVAVISNGTAVLGLGNIGPEAGKPVMEGKALLFKIFADIDCFDIELDASDPQLFINTVKAMAPTFGGINLEDIKAPECFDIENSLKKSLDIPVMHDDQHGTATITTAGLINALYLQNKKAEDVRVVVNGAGAAAIACTNMFLTLGVKLENVVMCDSKGVIRTDRENLSDSKRKFATSRPIYTLAEAMVDADVFMGLSVADVLTPDMLISMAPRPIVFALANPKPEIDYDIAIKTRSDLIMATGRSDLPNQINNVLGFPYIFRAALDTRATDINDSMKIAAATAIAHLAREVVPDYICHSLGVDNIQFGKNYIVPAPFDHRLLPMVTTAVAKAAEDSGVARASIGDYEKYACDLTSRMKRDSKAMIALLGYSSKNTKRNSA